MRCRKTPDFGVKIQFHSHAPKIHITLVYRIPWNVKTSLLNKKQEKPTANRFTLCHRSREFWYYINFAWRRALAHKVINISIQHNHSLTAWLSDCVYTWDWNRFDKAKQIFVVTGIYAKRGKLMAKNRNESKPQRVIVRAHYVYIYFTYVLISRLPSISPKTNLPQSYTNGCENRCM